MRKPFRLSQEALRTKNDFDAAVNAKPRLFKAQGVTLCKNYNAASCLNLSIANLSSVRKEIEFTNFPARSIK
jgi:hypothetical protein